MTKSKVWCPPDSNESSKTPEKNSQASRMKLNGWEETSHESLGSHWERIRVPLGSYRAGSGAADLYVSGLNCLRWGQHSKNPVHPPLPKCPLPGWNCNCTEKGRLRLCRRRSQQQPKTARAAHQCSKLWLSWGNLPCEGFWRRAGGDMEQARE